MRNLLFALCVLSIFACDNPQEDASNVAKAVVTSQAIKPIVMTPDTTKPKPRRYSMTDPARQIGDINTIYPFDIALKDADGKMHNSSNILKSNGKPTIVLFWLTTCYPCRIEMKAVQKQMDAWKEETDFNIVAISTDFEKNYGSFVKMVEENNWSFDAYVDVNREFRKVMPGGLNGLPQSFVFDKNGDIALHKRKYSSGDEHKLYEKVKALAGNTK